MSDFQRHVATLAVGIGIAQAIPVLASPLLARLYSPADFGTFALFIGLASLLGVPATLRYYLAIVVPEEERRGQALMRLSLMLVLVYFGFLSLFVLVGGGLLTGFGYDELSPWFFLLPVAVLLFECVSVLTAWANRHRWFGRMATSKISQGSSMTLVQVLAGAAQLGTAGLIAGALLGQLVGGGILAKALKKRGSRHDPISFADLRTEAKRFRRFPLFSLPADFVNVAANQLPLLLLAQNFGVGVTGQYNLTVRVLAAPIVVLGTATVSVFQERAARDYAKTGDCRGVYLRTFRGLLQLSLVPFLAVAFLAPAAFALAFGETWRPAGEYARLLSPLFLLRFVASPLSYVLYISGKQAYDLVWQVCLVLLTTIALSIGGRFRDPSTAILLFSASYSVMYVVYLGLSYHFSKTATEGGVAA